MFSSLHTIVWAESTGQTITRAVLLGIESFAFYRTTGIAAENNVWNLAATLLNTEQPPQLCLAFGGGSVSENPLVYQTAVRDAQSLSELLDYAFAGSCKEDVLLLYICTHGEYETGGECGLVLSDGQSDSLLPPETLAQLLEPYAGRKLLILDACHSGAMIGRGLPNGYAGHPFGTDTSILCSCGATEDSWFWTSSENNVQGAFYFTDCLCSGINQSNGSPADANNDGTILLSELYAYLLETYGAGTPFMLLPEGEEICFRPAENAEAAEAVRDISFSSSYTKDGAISLGLTAYRPVSIAYRIIAYGPDGWDFENATVLYDEGDDYSLSGYAGEVTAGRKNRLFVFSDVQEGYVLLQILTMEEGKLKCPASHVIAILGSACPIQAETNLTNDGHLRILIQHEKPALFTIKLECGEQSCRLFTHVASRPNSCGCSEFITSLPELHGECTITIQADFATESKTITAGSLVLP